MGNHLLNIGTIQMPVTGNKKEDLKRAEVEIAKLAAQGADVVVLPEMFCCPYDPDAFRPYAEVQGEGEAQDMMARAAKNGRITLIGGSIPEAQGDKLYNASFVYSPQGDLIGVFRKNHLFDVAIEGGQHFQESKTLSPSQELLVFDQGKAKIGVGICFDIRFPQMALAMRDCGAEILIYPAAFNTTTGPLHWELVCRARAVDTQTYLIGAAPAPHPQADYPAWGHSLLVDPWGEVLADLGQTPTTALWTLDLDRVSQARAQIPLA